MDFPPTVTARNSGLSRAPPQVEQGSSRMYLSSRAFTLSLEESVYFSKSTDRTPEKVVSQWVSRPSRVW